MRTLYIGFFSRHHVDRICSFPVKKIHSCCRFQLFFQYIYLHILIYKFSFSVYLYYTIRKIHIIHNSIFTHHCIKYISSPLSSAEPRILSASNPLLNPSGLLLSSSIIIFLLLISSRCVIKCSLITFSRYQFVSVFFLSLWHKNNWYIVTGDKL